MSTPEQSRQRILIVFLTILGCLLAVFFGARSIRAFQRFKGHLPPPPHASEIQTDVAQIREWMTVPYVARTYGVPGGIIFDALGIPPQGNHNKSLKELNEEYFPETDGYVVETVKRTILAHQAPPTLVPPIPPPAPSP